MSSLTTLNCPGCDAPIPGPGRCPYCGAEVRAAAQPHSPVPETSEWANEARALIAEGRKIAAIKLVRQHTGMGLKDAKEFVERDMMAPPPSLPIQSTKQRSCFPATAIVDTPDGGVFIAELRPGDVVWSFERGRGRVRARVTRRIAHPPAVLWTVSGADGTACTATGNHRLLTTAGWQRVDRLCVGDVLLRLDGQTRICTVGPCGRREPVYNVHTTGPHTVIIDGCIAHNFSTLPALQVLLHRLFVDPWRGHGAPLRAAHLGWSTSGMGG